MRNRGIYIGLAAALIIALGVGAFLYLKKPPAPDAIRVGATVSASGKFSTEIGPFQRLFQAGVDEVNQAMPPPRGGITKG
jgi:uncharacterized membrane protein